jgi:hypothetical protein
MVETFRGIPMMKRVKAPAQSWWLKDVESFWLWGYDLRIWCSNSDPSDILRSAVVNVGIPDSQSRSSRQLWLFLRHPCHYDSSVAWTNWVNSMNSMDLGRYKCRILVGNRGHPHFGGHIWKTRRNLIHPSPCSQQPARRRPWWEKDHTIKFISK